MVMLRNQRRSEGAEARSSEDIQESNRLESAPRQNSQQHKWPYWQISSLCYQPYEMQTTDCDSKVPAQDSLEFLQEEMYSEPGQYRKVVTPLQTAESCEDVILAHSSE